MKSKILTQIIAYGILAVFLSVMVSPVLGAPLIGGQGSKIQANFMSQDPDPADAGKDLDLRWQVVNTLSTPADLKFHLDAGYPFLFEAGDSPDQDLGTSAGTNDNQVYYVLHYKLRVADNAIKGTYNVTLSWDTGQGWTKKDFPIYIDPKRADFVVGALVTSPEKLIADTQQAKLSVDINNIGKGNAENVKVKLFLPSGFNSSYSYSDEDSLGIIAEGGSKTATFYADVDENIKEGDYNARLEVTYKDENDENNTYRTKTLALSIPIKPAPHLIVESVTTVPENLTPGNKAEIHIKVKNTGNKKAEAVSLRVFKDASQPFEFNEKSDFVGKLEPGESGDAVLRFTVDGTAVAKTYLIDTELRGIDETNEVVIFDRTVPLIVNPAAKGSPLASAGLVGGLVIVLGAIVARHYWKNKRSL
ncbi:MAG: CARDB domain-containing protein [Candidatus Methanoperedens sp.]|nr:NEW3 domain-containing protein [Candidatus Methanoperedens sp.]MCZ7396024.1 NEW3 domain-containing protein [Candidatus Methanoperedens sp.]